MASKALSNKITKDNTPVPQTQKAAKGQKRNNAGGFSFVVTDESRLERFLVLGTDGGTYYVKEEKLTDKNVDFIVKLIKTDPELVLNTVVEVSAAGRAYRNSYAIFVMALLFKHASAQYKSQGFLFNHLPQVARTSTHLFEFASYIEGLGGWGRAKREAVANWYTSKTPDQLAYQAVKYRQRDGWTHRDLFRLSHPKGVDRNLGNFILGKPMIYSDIQPPAIIEGFKTIQEQRRIEDVTHVLDLHKNLPWEAVPTEFHKSPEVWQKLFENGQLQGQALLRQVTRLARLGMFKDMVFAREYANRLVDEEMIAKTRLHPIQYLLALIGHTEGQIPRNAPRGGWGYYGGRSKDWDVSPILTDALDAGFYKAFKHVEPANKRTFIGVDVSGSMSSMAMGIDLSCAQVAGAMAMTIARTEPYYDIRGFTSGLSSRTTRTFANYGTDVGLHDLGITANTPLNEAMKKVQRNDFGATDCSLPMEFAIKAELEIDTFVVLTDNETYAGNRHPHVALEDYRQKSGIDARMVVVGMTATNFTIANPKDSGMLDVVGADSALPRLIADFSAGRV